MNSMKKCSVQHKAELKHLGTVVINDLKNLKVGDHKKIKTFKKST